MLSVTLSNGLKVEGTPEKITDLCRQLGIANPLAMSGVWYSSKSRGLVKITEMETTHIRNAMLAMYRQWAESLSAVHGVDLVVKLRDGIDNVTFDALLTEYVKRVR